METIAGEIVSGVNWVVIFYILFALAVLIMANRFAGFDVVGILRTLAKEFGDLSRRKFTYGAINIAGLIIISAILIFNMVSDDFADIISYAFAMKGEQNLPDENALFLSVGVAAIYTLASILTVRISEGK